MFEKLTEKFEDVFKDLTGKGKLSPKNIKDALREVKRALLEADVNYKVVKKFIKDIEGEAVGEQVLRSISPGQQVVKIVHDELVKVLGPDTVRLEVPRKQPTILMMMGLQGSGKTTHSVKLAHHLRKNGFNPCVVGADIYRPAAGDQLRIMAEKAEIPSIIFNPGEKPQKVVNRAKMSARANGYNLLIVDTAGRLQIDDEMMMELTELKLMEQPDRCILVADAMTGQEAVNIAAEFDRRIGIDGYILSKMDGDARGGAALSLRQVTGKPIFFIGVGEKFDQLEIFHPDRQANRILGMGDVVSLVEKAQDAIDEKKAAEMEKKLKRAEFDLTDFLDQLQSLKKMGPMEDLPKMIPGMGGAKIPKGAFETDRLKYIEAIIHSMTPYEREHPHAINGSRRKRIANGSGTRIQDVNRLLKDFDKMKKMIKKMKKSGFFNNPGLGF